MGTIMVGRWKRVKVTCGAQSLVAAGPWSDGRVGCGRLEVRAEEAWPRREKEVMEDGASWDGHGRARGHSECRRSGDRGEDMSRP